MDELTKEFVAESQEGLERMELCLAELERRPGDGELVSEIFRTVHTIKGTTSFLGFTRLQTLAHAGESLLGALRDGKVAATAELVSGLLHLMDGLRSIVSLIDATGKEKEYLDDNDTALIEVLTRLKNGPEAGIPAAEHIPSLDEHGASGLSLKPPATASTQNRTLRIDVETLDHMMNLVGDLVLTRNQILQRTPESEDFPDLARRLDTVTADLRESVRQARMQPLGHLFAKFPRMVRDLAQTCGRHVRIEFEGQETGLDKTLLEAIRDPLTHAVRNAVDHGIEPPEARMLAGKPLEGVIRLRAFQQSGSVVIEVLDDGAGISTGALLKKAIDRGLVTTEQGARMTEREVLQLVFAPGISLSPEITHVSGRGVGMDVVRTNVQKVGGSVEIESILGSGTTLRLRMPLTLAIVPALVVRSGGQSFALPQHSLIELVHLKSCGSDTAVERIGTTEVFRLRDRLLPIVRLDNMLRLLSRGTGSYIAVIEEGGRRFGLVIDELNPPEEIVVKPLSGLLRNIGMYSGATVLGNGDLALILDVKTIADRAGNRSTAEAYALSHEVNRKLNSCDVTPHDEAAMIIYETSKQKGSNQKLDSAWMAIPLTLVERIERIPLKTIEYSEGKAVLQYRGDLIVLEDTGGVLAEAESREADEESCDRKGRPPDARLGIAKSCVEDSGVMVTVMICLIAKTSISKRFGIVVRRVLDVSSAKPVAGDSEQGTTQLTIVQGRVATLHLSAASYSHTPGVVALREVA